MQVLQVPSLVISGWCQPLLRPFRSSHSFEPLAGLKIAPVHARKRLVMSVTD